MYLIWEYNFTNKKKEKTYHIKKIISTELPKIKVNIINKLITVKYK